MVVGGVRTDRANTQVQGHGRWRCSHGSCEHPGTGAWSLEVFARIVRTPIYRGMVAGGVRTDRANTQVQGHGRWRCSHGQCEHPYTGAWSLVVFARIVRTPRYRDMVAGGVRTDSAN